MVRGTADRCGAINEWGGGICSKGGNPWTVIPITDSSIVSIITSIVVIITTTVASIVVISAGLVIIVVTIVVVSGTDDADAVEGQEVGVGGAFESADDVASSELEDAVTDALG